MATKPLAAIVGEASDPLLETIARVPLGAPASAEERAAVETAMAESKAGHAPVGHDELVRKIADAKQ